MRTLLFPAVFVLVGLPAFACSSSGGGSSGFFNASSGGSGSNGGSSGNHGGSSGGGASSGGPTFQPGDSGTTDPGGGCAPNPANAEIAGNNCDDDGDGKVDNVPTCDTGLAIDGPADAFAKAIGICDQASSKGFGLVSASYSRAFGSADAPHDGQWGILPKFGSVVKPREGGSLGVLSSGYAREWDDTSSNSALFVAGRPLDGTNYPTGAAPSGFPKQAGGCDQDNNVNDMIDVKLVIKAPPNAKGFTFDFDFYSSEWPAYVCSSYNDGFIAYLTAQGFNGGKADNVSFDSKNNPVSVNNGFFDRCTPNSSTGCGGGGAGGGTATCPGGESELGGTGFGEKMMGCDLSPVTAGGATGWLTTQAPVNAGEQFTLEFMIWDAGDGKLDSSVLIDKFQWVGAPVTSAGTTRPPN